jgi:hypothetical protein
MSAGLSSKMSTILNGVAYAPQIESAASRYGLDPRLLAAVAAQETGGPGSNSGRNVVGDGGHGHGLFQIDDRYHSFARTPAAMRPSANADYAARMLSGLLHQYGGNVRKALSAYNAGDPEARGTVTTWADGSRLAYADSVMRHYAELGGSFGSLLSEMNAESASEQSSVNALSSFALLQPQRAPQSQSHSYRQLAGLDDSGHSTRNNTYDIISEDL